jgi:hypothetical protein
MENVNVQSSAKLAVALGKAQSKFKPLNKSKTAKVKMKSGGEYSYKYADLSDLIDAVRDALLENELAFTQLIQGENIETILYHSSGEKLTSTMFIGSSDTPQGLGSLITYARRYALGPMLGIAAEEDDDAQMSQAEAGNNKNKKSNQDSPPAQYDGPPDEAPHGPAKSTREPAKEKASLLSNSQLAALWAAAGECNWTRADVHEAIKPAGFESTRDIPPNRLGELIDHMKKNKKPALSGGQK